MTPADRTPEAGRAETHREEVYADRKRKGVIYKARGRWWWECWPRGVEGFSRSSTRDDVLAFIKRVCRAEHVESRP